MGSSHFGVTYPSCDFRLFSLYNHCVGKKETVARFGLFERFFFSSLPISFFPNKKFLFLQEGSKKYKAYATSASLPIRKALVCLAISPPSSGSSKLSPSQFLSRHRRSIPSSSSSAIFPSSYSTLLSPSLSSPLTPSSPPPPSLSPVTGGLQPLSLPPLRAPAVLSPEDFPPNGPSPPLSPSSPVPPQSVFLPLFYLPPAFHHQAHPQHQPNT